MALIFVLGGSGLSVDIAKCCSHITGFSVSLGHNHDDKNCGACVETTKKSCCQDVVIQTVINPVLGLNKTIIPVVKVPVAKIFPESGVKIVELPSYTRVASDYDAFDHQYPVPILIQKRVLQI